MRAITMSDEKAIILHQRPLPVPLRRDLAVAGATGAALALTWGAARLAVRLLQRRAVPRPTTAPAPATPPTPVTILYRRYERRVYLLRDIDYDG